MKSCAILIASLASLVLTFWNVESYLESRQAFYAEFSAATATIDASSVAAMTKDGFTPQYLTNSLRQLLYGRMNLRGAILATIAIALLWILRMR
jgi:hypothetical protein